MLDVAQIAPNCQLGPDGIWYADRDSAVSYPAHGHASCAQVEEASFWFNHRNACVVAAVCRFPPPPGEVIFDVGGGNGYVSLGLLRAGYCVAVVEPGVTGARNARQRGIPVVLCATTTAAGFAPASLGAIGLFDVIEHIQDDLQFLKSMRALLKTGGRLYATVPAYPALWSAEDVDAGHFRRYTLAAICRKLRAAGFALEFESYIFRPLPIPIFLLRALPARLGFRRRRPSPDAQVSRDHLVGQDAPSRWLCKILASELKHLRAGTPMAFGGSCLVVARAI
ncbi:MAG: class I SAM-dependent methyltransferase [Xanthomonadales bacterium]|jgi:SAM-dependent methyltransferase|nr:class I SAM-dependent methyltransferase [Xanthomonadales bacterium]